MMLEEICLKTYAKFGKGRFTVGTFSRLHRISGSSAKVLIHRLAKSGQALRARRGEYVLLSPVNFLRLLELQGENKKLHSLAMELFRMFPELKMLVLYGSQVRGDADRYSDYDVLLILPEKDVESGEVRQRIEKRLGIRLHLTVYSENGYRSAVLSEPYIRFWLAEGIIFDEADILRAPLPPVPKMAYEEWLSTARTYMENAGEAETAGKKCGYYFTALEILECIREALQMRYDFASVKLLLEGFVGKEIIARIRAGARMGPKNAALLGITCEAELKAIVMTLSSMGDNEADVYWKKKLAGGIV
jgi:predicted nucleotidyltransferase